MFLVSVFAQLFPSAAGFVVALVSPQLPNFILSTLQVWDIDNFELIETLEGHENPVCTLSAANSLLFSGSLKVVKVSWTRRLISCVTHHP